LCADDVAGVIERARPATSQHLRILRNHGIVEGTRRGTTVYYRLRPGRAAEQVRAVVTALQPPMTPPG
jgi:DNA-binding transcriptional ArsR family regulator